MINEANKIISVFAAAGFSEAFGSGVVGSTCNSSSTNSMVIFSITTYSPSGEVSVNLKTCASTIT